MSLHAFYISLDVGADACKLPDWSRGLHKSARSMYSYHQNELTLHVPAFQRRAPHIIVSDIKPATFGYSEGSHWQDFLRGQERFNYGDFQQEIRNGGVGFAVRLDS